MFFAWIFGIHVEVAFFIVFSGLGDQCWLHFGSILAPRGPLLVTTWVHKDLQKKNPLEGAKGWPGAPQKAPKIKGRRHGGAPLVRW